MKLNPSYTAIALIIIYISLVFFCCLHHFSGADNLDLGTFFLGIRLDRYIHFVMFFPYPFTAWLFLNYNKKFASWSRYTPSIILLSGFVLATVAEASQELFTSYRDTDPFDLVANYTGISAATLLVYILQKPIKNISNWIFTI